jgi:hypothetical protein
MEPLPRPPKPAETPEQAKARLHQQQLRISYGLLFTSDHGRKVLADLQQRFGFEGDLENPSYFPGDVFERVTHREGQKEVVRHILAMIVPPKDGGVEKPPTTAILA